MSAYMVLRHLEDQVKTLRDDLKVKDQIIAQMRDRVQTLEFEILKSNTEHKISVDIY